jgi:hypothetical protein
MKNNIITLVISMFLMSCAAQPPKPVKVNNNVSHKGYSLAFNNFSSAERMSIEDYLVALSGYNHHRPVDCSRRRCEYWYETDSSSARLYRNINQMLKQMGIEANVVINGNTIQVDRITLRQ